MGLSSPSVRTAVRGLRFGVEPLPFLGILLLGLLAFYLRLYRIDWQSLWVDENFTFLLSSQDLASITSITLGDVHPPLYYYLAHYWIQATGQSEFSLRFLSLIFSLLLVPLTFRTGTLLMNRQVGLLAGFLTAIAPFQVYYGQEARMYSLLAFLSLLSMHAMARVAGFGLSPPGSGQGTGKDRVSWAALVLSSGALLWVHYFGLLFLLFQNTAVLLTRLKDRAFLLRWGLSQAAVAVLFSPWAMVLARVYATNDEPWRRHIPLLPMLQEIMLSLSLGQAVDEALAWPLAAGFFLAMLGGVTALALKKGARALLLLLGLYLFQPILLAYLVSFQKPVYGGGRYFLFVAPAFYLLVSLGLEGLRKRSLPLFLILLAYLAGASGYSLANSYWDEAYAKDDYRGLARLIEERAGPGDGLVVMDGLVFDYYYRGPLPRVVLPRGYPLNQVEVIEELNQFSRGKSQLWLLKWKHNVVDPDDFLEHTLSDQGERTEAGNIRGLEHAAFRFASEAPFRLAIGRPLEANFDDKIGLAGYTLGSEAVAAGQALEVTLFMKATRALDQDYKVSLALLDPRGYPWAQEDKVPTGYSMTRWRVGEPVQSRFRLSVPLGTPPGEYTLALKAYAPANLEPLPLLDGRQTPLGTVLNLGRLAVERGLLPYDAASVAPSKPVGRDLLPEIRLLGYDLSPGQADQGGALTLVLYWQVLSQPRGDYQVSLRLLDGAGRLVQELRGQPHGGQYPTAQWRPGEIVRDVQRLSLAGDAPPGQSRVLVYLVGPGQSESQGMELASLTIRERRRAFQPPPIERPREEELGGKVLLLGYALDRESPRPGGKLALTLYWRAKGGGLGSYAVFTHLLDDQGRIWGQHDGPPDGGAQPTTGWIEGQVVTDKHQLAIRPEAPPGQYLLEVGMYDPASGLRLKLPDGQDRILLEKVWLR